MCVNRGDQVNTKNVSMLHAYRLVHPLSQHAPPQLWEYEQPYIDNLLLNARTFDRWVVQWFLRIGQH
jgi:hypothetical protein